MSAEETRTNVRVTRRDEGVPPYRRPRRESDTIVISSVSREIPRGKNENNRTRYAAGRGRPALPTASPRIGHVVISSVSREIPRARNENKRTRYAAGRGRPALPTASPRIGHDVISSVSREIPHNRNENNRTRIPQYLPARAPRPALPTASPRIGHDVISSVSREIPRARNENKRTRYAAGRGRPALPARGGSPLRRTSDYTKNRSELLFGSVLLTFIRFWFSVRSLSDFADNSGLRSAVTLRRDRLLRDCKARWFSRGQRRF